LRPDRGIPRRTLSVISPLMSH